MRQEDGLGIMLCQKVWNSFYLIKYCLGVGVLKDITP